MASFLHRLGSVPTGTGGWSPPPGCWWLPRWLTWLPKLDVEGLALERPAPDREKQPAGA